ncbi:MAG: 50S ribosomal protein L32 [Candidatus Omnitrophota bacterium]|nr:50S ribosomal protein L32 [Candidatus Omnitrophota bacterium]
MAHPKRKHSRSRTLKKRTHKKIFAPALVECTQCRKLKPSHMICPFCGYYAGREVVTIELKEKKRKG